MGLQLGKCHIDSGSPSDVDRFLAAATVGDGLDVDGNVDLECFGKSDGDYLTFIMNSTSCGTTCDTQDQHWYTYTNHVKRK